MTLNATPALKALLAHKTWARHVARCLVGDEATADDLVQNAWIAGMRRPPRDLSRARPWLGRVIRNLARNHHRSAGRRMGHEAAAQVRPPQRAPEEILADAEQHRRVVDAVLALQEPFKTALVLRFYEGLMPSEIARRLDLAAGTVSSRIHRALEQLREELDERADGDRGRWMSALVPFAQVPSKTGVATATTTSTGVLAMALGKMNGWLLSGLLLLLVGGGAYLLFWSSSSSTDKTATDGLSVATGEPGLVGQGPVPDASRNAGGAEVAPAIDNEVEALALPPRVEGFVIRGKVVDPRGNPVDGAEVFVLPKQSPGIDTLYLSQPRFGLVRTDETGSFEVRAGSMRAPQLIAWLDGYLPVSLDRPERQGKEPVVLQLGAPRMLRLHVENEKGVWPAGAMPSIGTDYRHTHDRTADPRLQSFFGGHAFRYDEERTGPLDIAVGTLASVRVDVATPWGYVASPKSVIVGPDVRDVRIRLHRSARLRIKVVPAEGGPAFDPDTRFEAYVLHPDKDEIVWSSSHPQPAFDFNRELSVGKFRFQVRSRGRTTVTQPIEFLSAGQEISRTVPLAVAPVDPQRATVRIRTTRGGAVPLATRKLAASNWGDYGPRWIVLARRRGDRGWRSVQSEKRPKDEISLVSWFHASLAEDQSLAGGEYDFLVAEGGTGRVGVVKGVRIFNDQENVIDVRLEPGCFVRLSDVLDPDVPRREITVETPPTGVLPPYAFVRGGQTVWEWSDHQPQLTQIPLLDTLFGPFPGKRVQVKEVRGR